MDRSRPCLAWIVSLALFGLTSCTLTPPQGGFDGAPAGRERLRQINTRLGAAVLDSGSWGTLDAPTQIAIDFAEETPQNWLLLDTGFHLGQDEEGERLTNGDRAEEGLTTLEVSGGLLAQPLEEDAWLQPYAGVGVSALWAESDLIADDELVGVQDGALGVYGKAGLRIPVRANGWIGLELRYLEAGEIDTATGSRDVGGAQISFVLGASF